MTRFLNAALASLLALTLTGSVPAAAFAQPAKSCCGHCCPVKSKTPMAPTCCPAPAPAAKTVVASVAAPAAAAPSPIVLPAAPSVSSLVAALPEPAARDVLSRAPSGLSPPAAA